MTLERLYRKRNLHRGRHSVLESIELWRLLYLRLAVPINSC